MLTAMPIRANKTHFKNVIDFEFFFFFGKQNDNTL